MAVTKQKTANAKAEPKAAAPKKPRAPRAKKAAPAHSEETIRDRAYQIWEEEGKPHGRHHEHWLRAEKEIQDNH